MMIDAMFCTINLEPRAKGRPRATAAGGVVRQYTPAKTRHWSNQFQALIEPHAPAKPLEGPCAIRLRFIFRRPKRLQRRKDPDGLIAHDVKPDTDNLLKSCLDAMDAAGWFMYGDQQLQSVHASKWYAEKGRGPRIQITLWRLEDDDQGDS